MLQKVQHLRVGILVLLFALPLFIAAQDDYTFQVKTLSAEDGLLGQRAQYITEDKNGFIWIATLDGLNRFDGYTFKRFNPANSALDYSFVNYALPTIGAGYVWLNYKNRGVECLNISTFEILTFTKRFKNAPFPSKDIYKVYSSAKDGSILIHTLNEKVYRLKNGEWMSLPTLGTAEPAYFNSEVVWYTQDGAVYKIDANGNVSKELIVEATDLTHVNENKNGVYALARFSRSTNAFTVFNYLNGKLEERSTTVLPFQGRTVNSIHYNGALDKYILGTSKSKDQNEAFVLDAATGQLQAIPLNNYSALLYIDKKGVLWFNTLTSVVMVNIQPTRFDVYEETAFSRGIWANDEFVVVNSEKGKPTIFNRKSKEKTGNLTQKLFATFQGDKDNLWGAYRDSLFQIDVKTGETVQTILRSKKLTKNTWALLKDNNGDWWTGVETGVIGRSQKSAGDSILRFDHYNTFDDVEKAVVIHLLEDGDYVWASSDQGLILIHKENGVVGHYHKAAEPSFQLPFSDVHFLHQDKDNVFWAATNYQGLVRFELNDKKEVKNVKQYTVSNNLSYNVLYTIFEDDHERLWISTLNGISCFYKNTEEVLTFSSEHNLPSNEFNRISGFQAADGRIYFGAMQGAIGFHPDSIIEQKPYEANLLLGQVQKYSGDTEELIEYTASVLETQTITQYPNERYFTIEVGMTDFFNAKTLQYSYQIEGLHNDFRLMDGNRLQLSNLPYGEYQLHIKGQAADKRYSEDEIILNLHIIRPYYLRWWFVLLAIALIISIFLIIYNYRLSRLKRQKSILEQTVVERTKELKEDKIIIEAQSEELKALDKLKDRFFTNISHELRTPLKLILSPLGTLLKSKNLSGKELNYAQIIQRHARYLLKRINEIMELNQLEAKKGEVNYQPVRFYDFVKIAVGSFESIAPQKNITLLFDFQLNKEIQILLDKNKYEHIIYNYLSNAFKYTSENGKVEVVVKAENNTMLLEVKDTGIGISQEAIPHVFDRFYQADNANKSSSSGVGLALCKEVADLVGGHVSVKSELGKGSVFSFSMPYKEVLGVINEEQLNATTAQAEFMEDSALIPNKAVLLSSENPKILLVEDNPDLRNFIQLILSEFSMSKLPTMGKKP